MEQVLAQWKRYLDGLPTDSNLRPVILASWQRSHGAGVDPQPQEVRFRRVADDDLHNRLAACAELVAVATPHLEWATAFLQALSHVVYLTDRDGIVLRSWGHRSLIDNFGLAPGFDWSERAMGTNGAGTALATNQPVAVIGPEHFTQPIHDCTCTAAPIHGPGGEVIGAIDISTSVAEGSPERVLLAAHIAFVIDRELSLREQVRRSQVIPAAAPVAGIIEFSGNAIPGMTLEDQLRQRTAELRASEQRFRLLVEGTADYAMFLLDPAGYVRSWNPGAERIKGYQAEEIIGQHCSRFFPEEDVQAGKPDQQLRVAATEGRSEVEGWRVRKDGSRFWASVITTALRDEAGTLKGFSKITRDLTERRRSEERFRLVVDSAPTAMLMIGQDGTICLANAQAAESFGYSSGELIGKAVEVLVPVRFRERHVFDRMAFSAAPHPRRMGQGRELFGLREDGAEFPVEIGLQPLSMDNGTFVIASVIDITERKRAEHELRASEELARSILNAITAHVAVLDDKGNIVAVNSAWERFAFANDSAGLSRSGVGTNYLEVCRQAVQEGDKQAAKVVDGLERILKGLLQDFSIEYPCHSPTEERWFILHAKPLSTRLGGAVVSHTSITESKRTEAALRESEARFRQLADSIPQLVWMAHADGYIYWYNKQWYEYTGTTPEQMEGWGWQSVHDPAVLPKVLERWRASITTGEPFDMVFPLRRADGQFGSFLTRVMPVRNPEGRILQWFGTNTDITERVQMEASLRRSQEELEGQVKERMQAEEALRASERTYRAIGESIDYGVWVCDSDGKNIYASPSFLRLVGLTQEQCAEFGWANVLHPDDAERTIAAWRECVQVRGKWDFEHRFRGVDGQWHPVLARGVPVEDDQGNIVLWAGINLDISRLKEAEAALRQAHDRLEQRVQERTVQLTEMNESLRREIEERRATEARLRDHTEEIETLMDVLPVPVWITHDPECRQMTGNRATYELTRLPKGTNVSKSAPQDERPNFRVYHDGKEVAPEDLPMHRATATGMEVRNAELDLLFEDGSIRSIFGFAAPLFDTQRRVRGCIGVFIDITERKQAEKAIRAALQERETLLKEVHHRVKNNLQVISSLLHMQSLHTPDKASVELFRESQHRVRSMALVHERLYRSPDMVRVDFTDYIESLANYLFRSYHVETDRIRLEVNVQGIRLPINAAVPCGLLVNELISNCLKHAFQGRDRGSIRVELVPVTEAEALLSVSDDGVGLPPSIIPESAETFGMQLIVALVDQLHGRLEVCRQGGTTMRIIFPLAN